MIFTVRQASSISLFGGECCCGGTVGDLVFLRVVGIAVVDDDGDFVCVVSSAFRTSSRSDGGDLTTETVL